MPINSEHLARLTDADVIDQHGDKVGGVGQIYLDDASGQPAWASVKSGLFGLRESFVPLATAEVVNGNISVPFTKDFIKDAPRVDADNHMDDGQQATLYSYYGLERPSVGDDAGGADDVAREGSDETTTFASEQTSEEMHEGRTTGVPTSEGLAQEGPEGDWTSERLTEGESVSEEATQARPPGEPAPMGDSERDGAVASEYTTPGGTEATTVGGGDGDNDLGSGPVPHDEPHGAAATGSADRPVTDADGESGAAVGAPERAEPRPGDPDWDETAHARFQQENPAAHEDWAAEQAPEEPVSTPWSVPPTDPADEEPTRVGRSGYAADRPAAHSSAYQGHEEAVPGRAVPGPGEGTHIDQRSDERADDPVGADAPAMRPGAGTGEVDPGRFGSVEPVTAAGGGAAADVAASDTETTAYEVPGQEFGSPTTDARPGAEFAADREEPFDGSTEPQEGAGRGSDDESEAFGPTGYRPDRDGSEMTDEERERLNRARGAL